MKESFRQNIKNIGVGIAVTAASIGTPKDADAQHGLLGKIKDKIKDKVEMVESKHQPVEEIQNHNNSIIYNSESDNEGFKYPFDKEYKTDENFYRTVAYAHSFTLEGAHEDAFFEALIKLKEENNLSKTSLISIIEETYFENKETGIITSVVAIKMPRSEESKKSQTQESKFIGGVKDKEGVEYPFSKVYESDKDYYRVMAVGTGYNDRRMTEIDAEGVAFDKIRAIIAEELKINGNLFHLEMNPKIIVSRYDKNIETGIYTNYIAVEVPRNNIKIEKVEPKVETEKTTEVSSNKADKSPVVEIEKTRNNQTPKVEKSDYHVTFEDFKKTKESEFDSFKKAQEEKFNKFKNNKEN